MDEEYEQLQLTASQLRRERIDAEFAADDARFAAREAHEDVAAEAREGKRKAEWQAREAERFRLAKHRALMDLYDTMTPEEISAYVRRRPFDDPLKDSPLRQPLAPGQPRVYNLRGDPATWQLP